MHMSIYYGGLHVQVPCRKSSRKADSIRSRPCHCAPRSCEYAQARRDTGGESVYVERTYVCMHVFQGPDPGHARLFRVNSLFSAHPLLGFSFGGNSPARDTICQLPSFRSQGKRFGVYGDTAA